MSYTKAQKPSGIPYSGAGNKMGSMPSIGHIYGKVIDVKTKQAVEFCSVALFVMPKDSAVSGALTKGNGDFSLENLPFGMFTLRIKFIGYKMFEQKILINMQSVEKDLGDIKIEPDISLLKAVEVTEEKGNMSFSIDRKVYNVSKDLSVTGGTGEDAVKNIPSVSVDADGAVTLRNSSVQIFIDGKPTTLTLQQIPADQIDRIEVITNPSVKFDANTTGGILNVILKKNNKPGYNGTVMAGIGTNDRYNAMASLNIKEKPFNFSVMYNFNRSRNNNNGFTNRENISTPYPVKYFNQNNLTIGDNSMQMARLSVDYSINNRNTITVGGNVNTGYYGSNDMQTYSSKDTLNEMVSYGNRTNSSKSDWINYTGQLGYKRTFPKAGKELTADASYNYGNNDGGYLFTTYDYLGNGTLSSSGPSLQKSVSSGRSGLYNFQVDFTNPINDSTKIEFGIKSTYKQSTSYNFVSNYFYPSSEYIEDSALTNDYKIDDLINGAYINYSRRVKKLNIQAGLRVEQSDYKGTLLNKPNESFSYSYPTSINNILNSVFPGLYFSRSFSKKHEVQLNFSRKINRPNYMQTMPFVMFADKYNYRIGNPSLAPEFINMAEMNYNFVSGKTNYLTSIFGKYVENPITNIAYSNPSNPSILINTFKNGDNSFSYGWENSLKFTVLKNLNVTANATAYYLTINYIDSKNNLLKNNGYSWESKLILSYRFPLDITFQANGGYEAPRIIPQGKTLEMYFMDLSLNKNIKQRLIFNLTLSDVFNTKRRGTHYDTPDYIQDLSRRRDSRFLKFSVTWIFGKVDASMFKRKNSRNKNNSENADGGMDF